MGTRGPAPKRTEQRRNRVTPPGKKAPTPVAHQPKLTGRHSAVGRRMWNALALSGQSQWYTSTDWVAAETLVCAIDDFVSKPTAGMLAAINQLMAKLLITEGDRRRVQVELEPEDSGADNDRVSELDEYRRRISG